MPEHQPSVSLGGTEFQEILRKAQKQTILAVVKRVIDDNPDIEDKAVEEITKIVVATTNYFTNDFIDRLFEVAE